MGVSAIISVLPDHLKGDTVAVSTLLRNTIYWLPQVAALTQMSRESILLTSVLLTLNLSAEPGVMGSLSDVLRGVSYINAIDTFVTFLVQSS